jgi:hypothetical protein
LTVTASLGRAFWSVFWEKGFAFWERVSSAGTSSLLPSGDGTIPQLGSPCPFFAGMTNPCVYGTSARGNGRRPSTHDRSRLWVAIGNPSHPYTWGQNPVGPSGW